MGSNFPANPKLIKEETDFDANDKSKSENARHTRWLQLMEQNKGKIDVAAGQRFLADHFDTFEGQDRSQRAHAVRPHRAFAARHGAPGRRLTRPPARCRTRSPTPPAPRR